ncbi:MAG TPA: hypothetical protein VMX13_15560 [Sedimentisphaerales bacterium]|nr:hypothetical protein [Sedimentisphaerales bacterium]
MINLDDANSFEKVLEFQLNEAFTYSSTASGHTDDPEKRERIRAAAQLCLPPIHIDPNRYEWWAFRIKVNRCGQGQFDIDNVPKNFIDAFCGERIQKDGSQHATLALFQDDTIDHVKYLEVYGDRVANRADERTQVEIFGKLPDVS